MNSSIKFHSLLAPWAYFLYDCVHETKVNTEWDQWPLPRKDFSMNIQWKRCASVCHLGLLKYKNTIYNKMKADRWTVCFHVVPLLTCKWLCSMLHKTANNEAIWASSVITFFAMWRIDFVVSTVVIALLCMRKEFIMQKLNEPRTK